MNGPSPIQSLLAQGVRPASYYGDRLRIREADPKHDREAVMRLFESGLFDGAVRSGNEVPADIENLHQGYFSDDGGSGFWVAELRDHVEGGSAREHNGAGRVRSAVIGMIGVQKEDENTAEIRRLRVDPAHRRRGVAKMLMQHAVSFCKEHGYLKVVLNTPVDHEKAITLVGQFGFQLNRSRNVFGKPVLDFYMDLYSDPGRSGEMSTLESARWNDLAPPSARGDSK